MIKKIKNTIVTSLILTGLLANVLVVNAEEANESVAQEETIQLELKDNGEQVDVDGNKDMSAVSRQIHLENFNAEAAPAAEVNNTDPNNAALIDVNTIISDSITEAGQQRWYFFGANAGKLTLNLDFTNSQNVDYDIYLYLYDDASGTITLIDGIETSNYIEHFSRIVETGIYFVMVNGYSGYDAVNPYMLGTVLSTSYDAQEVDDRFQDAFQLSSSNFNITGTIDNMFDADIQKFTVTSAGGLHVSLTNNNSNKNIYAMDILNANGIKLGMLNQNENYLVTIPKGTYYFKVYCSTFGGDYNSTYTLKGDLRSQAARVSVTHAGDADQPIVDYVGGPYWRVYGQSYVEGIAYDSNGYIIPNADINIVVNTLINGRISNPGKTDSQGRFNIRLNIGPGKGQHSYVSVVNSIHYYDIVEVDFESNDSPIQSNVDHFYHFAYQIGPFSDEEVNADMPDELEAGAEEVKDEVTEEAGAETGETEGNAEEAGAETGEAEGDAKEAAAETGEAEGDAEEAGAETGEAEENAEETGAETGVAEEDIEEGVAEVNPEDTAE